MSDYKKALIIVDVQRDFCHGGALAVDDADIIVPMINRYIEGFSKGGGCIYAARDLHPEETTHFEAFGGKWPAHCVKGTTGAEFHPGLKLTEDTIIITKGLDPAEDCYSAFEGRDEEGRTLEESLRAHGVRHLYIAGLATEYCVKATAIDGRRLGFAVTVLIDAVKALNKKIGDSEVAIGEMRDAGASTRDYSCLVLQIARSMPKRRP